MIMVLQFKGTQFHYLLMTDTDREPEATIHRHSEESYSVFCVRGSLRELLEAAGVLEELESRIRAGLYALPVGEERNLQI